jgi:hypothetical protein
MIELSLVPSYKLVNVHYLIAVREWQKDLFEGKYSSQADLSRKLGVSRARVTQVLNLLKLPETIT